MNASTKTTSGSTSVGSIAPGDPRTPAPKRTLRWRRTLLGAAVLALAGGEIAGGCATPFDPPSEINSLRVLAVVPERPDPTDPDKTIGAAYADPGDEVTLTMTNYPGYEPDDGSGGFRPVTVVWLGPCVDPPGDDYFGCYGQLAEQFQGVTGFDPNMPPEGIGIGDFFKFKIPSDIVSRRPPPATGPAYGIAYVFFLACAGTIGFVPPEGSGEAQSFPIGCFDGGKRLGSESFVAGYTQVYSFGDGRTNANPVVEGMWFDEELMAEDTSPKAELCSLTKDERRAQGCGAEDPLAACKTYNLKVKVPIDVAEIDPDSETPDGKSIREAVWVDYYAEDGDIESGAKLISDPVQGYIDDHETKWVPPEKSGLATVWAVVHDARGGMTLIQRDIIVE